MRRKTRDTAVWLVVAGWVGTTLVFVLPDATVAQTTTPTVFFACYESRTGNVYRIREPGLRDACRAGHVQFSWVDGDRAVRSGDAAGGDLTGTYPNPSVAKVEGRPVGAAAPMVGQVLAWDGATWAPASPGGGVTDHGVLTGLTDDDHPQYLLTDGVRATTNGFAVVGTFGTGRIPVEGPGVRVLWYPGKAAFRAGQTIGVQWDDGWVGQHSAAFGLQAIALGNASFAAGSYTSASGYGSTAMGNYTTASGVNSTAFGVSSTASGRQSTALGWGTTASAPYATALGVNTTASGEGSTALGGGTIASGDWSTTLGSHVRAGGDGSFAYGDHSTTRLATANTNQFMVRAAGGTVFLSNADMTSGVVLSAGGGAWASVSDERKKENVRDEDGERILQQIAQLPVRSWNYKSQDPGIRHLGPSAQDFYKAFGLGEGDTTISTVDADGVSLLGVQALERRTADLRATVEALRAEIVALRRVIAALRQARAPDAR